MPNPIKKGKIGHAIVAYGMYDNGNKPLCHYGWGGYSQVIVSSSLSGELFYWAWNQMERFIKQGNILSKRELNIRERILNNEKK
ncbi:hypothetical protein HU154_01950 [Metamycoplasma hominis]|nr:hypothetical protein [Metamycoplasma hominis]QKX31460.1 hypothetical protein HU152_02070 [Metamycoplasma hominis]QKX37277.1 hypothetical protein HU154_01950 [Metamycoplasma hominis]